MNADEEIRAAAEALLTSSTSSRPPPSQIRKWIWDLH